MKKILATILAMAFLVLPICAQAKQVDILRCDIQLNLNIHQQKMSLLNKALNWLTPSAWATSCVATNTTAGTVLGSLVAASTAGLNSGKLKLRDSGNNVLATLTLNSTVGSVATNVLTFGAIADNTASGGAPTNATNAVITNAGDTVFFTVDVGTAATTLIMNSVSITAGDTIHVTNVPTITLNLGT